MTHQQLLAFAVLIAWCLLWLLVPTAAHGSPGAPCWHTSQCLGRFELCVAQSDFGDNGTCRRIRILQ